MRVRGLRWLVAVAALLLLGAAGPFLWWRYATLPALSGSLHLAGLTDHVVVEREPSGVVHIRARNDRDLFFAQGVVHAQDRLWQMEFQRRIGAGRLAEVLGSDAVGKDRYLRTWGFYRAAEAAYEHISPEARAVVDAYAEGINAYVASDPPLPPEFRLLRVKPEPWSGPDVLVWSKLMAYNLADNRRSELRRYRLLARGLSPERIATLMPLYPGEELRAQAGLPTPGNRFSSQSVALGFPLSGTAEDPGAFSRQAEALLALDATNRQHLPRASNNWVVHGSRSESGLPLLANDVHLGMQIPSTWHLMHLKSPGFDVIGASLPGLPVVIIGRNRDIAWGVTNLAADVEDLYVLTGRGDDGYVYKGETRAFETREETILVNDGAPVTIRVRETVYGPVISDVVDDPVGAPPIALRWIGHDRDDTTFETFLGINRARNWDEFRVAMDRYVAPGQNFVYADRDGHIGYLASGRIPRRRAGHTGLYPVPGDGDWDWLGYLRRSELPVRVDPPEGFVVTANHRITGPDYPHQLSLEWGAEPYRAERIGQLLRAHPKHDLASMQVLQQDTLTLLYRELRPVLEAMTPVTPSARHWRQRLLAWNGDASADSTESSVFHAWYTALSTLPSRETGTDYWNGYPRFLLRALREGDSACERRGMSCLAFATRALERALDRVGEDPPPWGDLHRAHLSHAVLTHTPLAVLSDRVVSLGGSHYTVNVGWYWPEDWVVYHGPTYRQVIDMAAPEQSLFIVAGGQSGNWLSNNYADQLPLWLAGEYLPMRREGYPVADRLVLKPVQ
ncbi:MAG: penicillin acylase family protein [Pseudomonadota bacterium]|nr:penicillin acylase family protein [Pseudomonadota bacterium]